jgi:hypothetical protein
MLIKETRVSIRSVILKPLSLSPFLPISLNLGWEFLVFEKLGSILLPSTSVLPVMKT